MSTWDARLRIDRWAAKLLVSDDSGHDLLKARLPLSPDHPRALLTLLEGLALYGGSVLSVATTVAGRVDRSTGPDLLGDGPWPADSTLVRFAFAEDEAPRPRRLRGLGDFRDVRRIRAGFGR